MKRSDSPFASEADLCDAFAAYMRNDGWVVYPETAGFDMLLVRPEGDALAGLQLGVEAKLTLNSKVCEQIIPHEPWRLESDIGPDHRAVLVGSIGGAMGFANLLRILGVMVFEPERKHSWESHKNYETWGFRLGGRYNETWHDWNPRVRCVLPEFVPSVRAGVPSPKLLTPWKIGALKVMAKLEVYGSVHRSDVASCGVDARRFCAGDGWLDPAPQRGYWVRGERCPKFHEQHPTEYAELLKREHAAAEELARAE